MILILILIVPAILLAIYAVIQEYRDKVNTLDNIRRRGYINWHPGWNEELTGIKMVYDEKTGTYIGTLEQK